MKNPEHFWLNINKPQYYSSARVVSAVKKILNIKKVGHSGTLDPIATGVLPIAIGKATKTINYIQDQEKEYYCEIKWGEKRDTDDIEGKITSFSVKRPSNLEILSKISSFLGKIEQIPPQYSAIKLEGKRSYKLARSGKKFTLKARLIEIKEIRLIFNNYQKAGFFIKCSKGTYIRSFARDLGEILGSFAYISKLTRLKVGKFCYNQTISLDKLKILSKFRKTNFMLQTLDILDFIPNMEIDDEIKSKISFGQKFTLPYDVNSKFVKLVYNSELISIVNIEDQNKIKQVVKFIN